MTVPVVVTFHQTNKSMWETKRISLQNRENTTVTDHETRKRGKVTCLSRNA